MKLDIKHGLTYRKGAEYSKLFTKFKSACYENDGELVKKLISKGVDITDGQNYALKICCIFELYNIMQILIDNGLDVNAEDGWALIYCCEYNYYGMALLLLNNGADPTVQDNKPLSIAYQVNLKLAILLIDKGADISWCGHFLLKYYAEQNKFGYVRLLIEKGVPIKEDIIIAAEKNNHYGMARYLINLHPRMYIGVHRYNSKSIK